MQIKKLTTLILLFNGECGVCRWIAHWVMKSAQSSKGGTCIVVRPIGEDPEELRSLNSELNIWDAYETIHLLMPDGTMALGGEAVAGVLRNLPNTQWFSGIFAISIFGFRPMQSILNLFYDILSDVRPIFGCESCGTPSPWMKPLRWMVNSLARIFGKKKRPSPTPHFTALPARKPLPQSNQI